MDREILYVILPCYNEEENIRNLVHEWKIEEEELKEKNILLRMIIVNDGSIDNTFRIAKTLEDSHENITVLNHVVNKGLGEAINTGINYAIAQKNKGILCVMDADLTHQPRYIHSMIDKLRREKLQCVIASRYRKTSRIQGLTLQRKFLSYGARIVYTLFLNIEGVRDYTCGYRLYSISAMEVLSKKYDGRIIRERSFACMMELLFKLSLEGFKIGEVPFILKYQLKGGKSKMKVFKTLNRSLIMIGRLKRLVNEGII